MKDLTLYTWSTCPYCNKAKQLLNEGGYEFTDIDITDDPGKKDELTKQTGQRTVPYIFVEDELIGGCSDLIDLMNNGKFDTLVQN